MEFSQKINPSRRVCNRGLDHKKDTRSIKWTSKFELGLDMYVVDSRPWNSSAVSTLDCKVSLQNSHANSATDMRSVKWLCDLHNPLQKNPQNLVAHALVRDDSTVRGTDSWSAYLTIESPCPATHSTTLLSWPKYHNRLWWHPIVRLGKPTRESTT